MRKFSIVAEMFVLVLILVALVYITFAVNAENVAKEATVTEAPEPIPTQTPRWSENAAVPWDDIDPRYESQLMPGVKYIVVIRVIQTFSVEGPDGSGYYVHFAMGYTLDANDQRTPVNVEYTSRSPVNPFTDEWVYITRCYFLTESEAGPTYVVLDMDGGRPAARGTAPNTTEEKPDGKDA